jgi:predicted phage baseplate assembly protein
VVTDVRERSRCDYGLAAMTTVLTLNAKYMSEPKSESTLATLRDIDVFAHSERLTLAETPIAADLPDLEQAGATVLQLDGVYAGLAPGRWALVAGTRTDLPGVRGAELVMIALTEHRTDPAIAGDRLHTFITLSTKLAYRYARAGFTIAGNVVRATHGETRTETLGSGNAAQARQSFTFSADPLTFVAAPTQSGTQSTLTVLVNGVRWVEAAELSALGPADRAYTTGTSAGATTVTFGDGVHGARLPTGENNVSATYRVGLGAVGNVAAERLSVLLSCPAGVEAVRNPLPAGGGADAESRDDIRRNAPASLLASERLVALDDYAHFARTFAGVAKATATQIGFVRDEAVYVTLAGPDEAGIDPRGDLRTNLEVALRRLADPRRSLAIGMCDRVLLLIGASIDLAPGAVWETVEPAIRAALGATFGFSARDFGQPAFKSEAVAAIARVAGVVDVIVELFAGVSAATLAQLPELAHQPVVHDVVAPLPARQTGATIAPAQIVMLEPEVRGTVLLREAAGGAG